MKQFRPLLHLMLQVRSATTFLSSRTFDKGILLGNMYVIMGARESLTSVAGGLELLYVGGH
jgi:hypothetical protein